MKPILPELSRLRKRYSYNPDTGDFTHLRGANCVKAGDVVANRENHRYMQVSTFLAHRVAWAMFYNEEPPALVDHIDRDTRNNSISNLRDGTSKVNHYNSGMNSRNTSGVKGVRFDKSRDRWLADMGRGESLLYQGPDFLEAVSARKSAENRYWHTHG